MQTDIVTEMPSDFECCDFSDGVFFERRFIWWLSGDGLTVFQMTVVLAVMVSAVGLSSFLEFVLIQPGLAVSISTVVVFLLAGCTAGLIWSRRVDKSNREMKKTQGQYVIDSFRARWRKGHWVNGRRRSKVREPIRIVLSVASLHPRSGGKP